MVELRWGGGGGGGVKSQRNLVLSKPQRQGPKIYLQDIMNLITIHDFITHDCDSIK